ncbi:MULTISPECIES: AlpA family transcriptional regulator [unclassified Novosphingobium]|uniref:helix-turn-helix transcriptional regulator n=1 Tax=unclassified Novosphingobium TaxID=2644732 RepID=UPI000D439DF9|nr:MULTISPECIES: AlpA family phage regulatory protein [unclassified Novosphingobium]PTR08743.1 AlpA family transcriptional regulator [Novosphingobium sp. GV055]PUB01655.1 AlpA family transcriptional regulator [Novosphingobium sp. GV061]PUB17627.1 AlpA family transcriptional regulator [Novosphingobium sp. GV079]PUB40321.1 AlpA family transcriptional regulator [Novosphingobium sp. GV027]
MTLSPEGCDRLLRIDEVKRRVGLGKTMIYRLIKRADFPAPYKLSPFTARWSEREIVAWIDRVKDGFEGKKRRW